MSKTPEEMAEEFSKVNESSVGGALGCYRQGLFEGFLAGYKAAENHFRDVTEKVGPQWISVKNRLPDRDQEVLGYEKPFISTCLFWRSRSFLMEHQWELSNGRNCNPTHWMELPAPPKEEK
jgi:hypothetical protein